MSNTMTHHIRRKLLAGKDFTVHTEPQRKAVLMQAKKLNLFVATRDFEGEYRVVFYNNHRKHK